MSDDKVFIDEIEKDLEDLVGTTGLASEITTVGQLRQILAPFMDETELMRSVSLTYFMDLEHGSKIRIRED